MQERLAMAKLEKAQGGGGEGGGGLSVDSARPSYSRANS